jgi:flagellar protein FlgJ
MTAPVQKSPEEKLHEVSDLYEKHFLREMLKGMRSTVQEGGFVHANQAEKIFSEQLDDQYVEKWGDKGGIGLSAMIYKQLVDKFGAQMGIKVPQEKPHGMLPITDKDKFTASSTASPAKKDGLSYRFDRTNLEKPELGAPTPVTVPWDGVLLNKIALDSQENVLEIGHDNGLKSQLVYKGSVAKLSTGQNLQAGETLGLLSPDAKSLFWNVNPGPAPEGPASELPSQND